MWASPSYSISLWVGMIVTYTGLDTYTGYVGMDTYTGLL